MCDVCDVDTCECNKHVNMRLFDRKNKTKI